MAEELQSVITALQKVIVSDKAGNKFKFSTKPKRKNWLVIKSEVDVYFTVGVDGYNAEEKPEIRVVMTLEEGKMHMRDAVIADTELPEDFVPENNKKRPMDLFYKDVPWTDKKTFENELVTVFMPIVMSIRTSLKKV